MDHFHVHRIKAMKYLNHYNINAGKRNITQMTVIASLLLVLVIGMAGCKKFIQVPDPKTSTNAENVYTSDGDAAAVLTGIYTNLSNGGTGSPQLINMSEFLGLSADEFSLFNGTSYTSYINYYHNVSDNHNGSVTADFWSNSYQIIYVANSAIAGLTNNSKLTPAVDKQLLGEAKFMRAFCYFYLVNLYGDVPLTTGTSYTDNATLARTPMAQVYQQVISDLKDAEGLLSDQYLDGTLLNPSSDRVRPTKWAATALLARVYLYTKDWADAAKEASLVIGNNSAYSLSALNDVFLANSSEAIWQLQPVAYGANTIDAMAFILPSTGVSSMNPITLGAGLISNFEPGDKRLTDWTGSLIDSTGTVPVTEYYAYKYKVNAFGAPVTEYEMVLRLGEQFLIRAEAEAEQGDLPDAATDLNMIRIRAGLAGTGAATQAALLTAIQQERRVELFSEWGHRWLDLKRTGTVDAVMSIATPIKGGSWDTRHQLYPIANYELVNDPNLKQNPGY
jgi:starch-binding outer membrane protein, SusD/RagB family